MNAGEVMECPCMQRTVGDSPVKQCRCHSRQLVCCDLQQIGRSSYSEKTIVDRSEAQVKEEAAGV